ncbi:Somatostatin receptor type 4 [Trichoplax sp. H2]|nr:Somatostatin receptor type 4 [Trichoplax sp. H2]|eukprot:RDD36905.1 Somatostatin receptor type 4 [Trichoplax sp. H2]
MNISSNTTTPISINATASAGFQYIGGVVTQVLFGIIAILSIVGNALVLALFSYSKQLRNYSHGILIWNLALVDLLTGIFIIVTPAHIIREAYPDPPPGLAGSLFCKLIGVETFTFSFGVISMSILAILSLERRYGVVKPYLHARYFRRNRTKIMIVFAWIWGIILNVTNIIQGVHHQGSQPPCGWESLAGGPIVQKTVYGILFVLRFLLPLLCIVICYANILAHMRSTIRDLTEAMDKKETVTYKIAKKVTITCAVTSLAFLLCWLPNQIYFTLINFQAATINSDIHFVTKLLILFNSCINPFIYVSINHYYRQEFIKMMRLNNYSGYKSRAAMMSLSLANTNSPTE